MVRMLEEIAPPSAAERLRGPEPPLLVDVREPWERELASIPGSMGLPMSEAAQRLEEFPRDRDIIVHCHHGGRSAQTAAWLESQGYTRLANLAGGIDEWSQTVDPEIPRY